MANSQTWFLPLLFLGVFIAQGISTEPEETDLPYGELKRYPLTVPTVSSESSQESKSNDKQESTENNLDSLELVRQFLAKHIDNAFERIAKVVQDEFDSLSSVVKTPMKRLKREVSDDRDIALEKNRAVLDDKDQDKYSKDDAKHKTLEEFYIIGLVPDPEGNNVEMFWKNIDSENLQLDWDDNSMGDKEELARKIVPAGQQYYYDVDSSQTKSLEPYNNMEIPQFETTVVTPTHDNQKGTTYLERVLTTQPELAADTEKEQDTQKLQEIISQPAQNSIETDPLHYVQQYTQTLQYPQEYTSTVMNPTYAIIQSEQQKPEPTVLMQEIIDIMDSEVVEKVDESKVMHINHSARYRLTQTTMPSYTVPQYY